MNKKQERWKRYFFEHVKQSGDCMIYVNKHGKPIRMSRQAWKRINGKIPENMYVCHTCDNPVCVKIEHLFLGTQKDNMQDCKNKNRHPCRTRLGYIMSREQRLAISKKRKGSKSSTITREKISKSLLDFNKNNESAAKRQWNKLTKEQIFIFQSTNSKKRWFKHHCRKLITILNNRLKSL